MLKNINLVAAQFPSDADRFINLGLPTDRIHIAGNIKFDLQPPAQLLRQAGLLRHILGGGRLVWIAASTHPGEERVIVEAFKQVRANLTNVLLVSVPRHIERATCLEHFYKKQGLNVIKRSENRLCVSTTDIFIGDTMGELLSFYAASDLAFVGGSLIKKGGGGHNPIEPAAVGVPILTGPYTFNFESITGQLRQQGIGFQISDSQSLAEQVIYLLSNPLKRKKIGIKAKRFVRENTGASVKQLQLIESLI
jgi:3-deoxy-D-manno-octulosonic-acid transferase